MNLLGKKVIVTGANRNIGAAIAIELAGAGADVCVHYRSDETGADDVCKTINSSWITGHILVVDGGQSLSFR